MRALVLVAAISARAWAVTPTCVEVRSDLDEPGLRKLVDDELRHHPSHRAVESGCSSRLSVEIFTTAGVHYLTVRVNQEVPVRFAVKGTREIEEKLSEALTLALKNDPVFLAEDLAHMSAVMRAGTNLVRRGSTRYRIELFELFGWGVRNALFASGAAFGVFRGSEHLQVFARFVAAGSPRTVTDGVALRAMAGAEVGALWESSARGNTTFYLGPGVSLHYLRIEGGVGGLEQPAMNPWLFSLVLRTGLRFLRTHDVDVDLFAQIHLPLYATKDVDSPYLLDGYTPYGSLGLGVGF